MANTHPRITTPSGVPWANTATLHNLLTHPQTSDAFAPALTTAPGAGGPEGSVAFHVDDVSDGVLNIAHLTTGAPDGEGAKLPTDPADADDDTQC